MKSAGKCSEAESVISTDLPLEDYILESYNTVICLGEFFFYEPGGTSNAKVVIGILMLLLTYAAPRKRERLKLLRNSVLLKNRQNWHYLPHESCK